MRITATILLMLFVPPVLTVAAEAEHPGISSSPSLEEVLTVDLREAPASCSHTEYRLGEIPVRPEDDLSGIIPPPNPDGPTIVSAFLFILAVDDIDARTNSFHFQGYGGLVWCDPRLAFAPAEGDDNRKIIPGEQIRPILQKWWWPGVIIPSRIGEATRGNESMVVYSDGTVRLTTLFETRVAARYDFRDFPFDRQTLEIPIQPEFWHATAIELEVIDELTGFNEGFEIPEWSFAGYRTDLETIEISSDGQDRLSRLVIEIDVARQRGFYFWKIFLPLLMIAAIPWSVFWMSRDVLAQRQRQAATGLLTLVAFQFVAGATLPRVSYLTLMDAAFLWAFVTAVSVLWLNVRNARLYRSDPELGLRADRSWRWLFPIVYVTGMAAICSAHQLI